MHRCWTLGWLLLAGVAWAEPSELDIYPPSVEQANPRIMLLLDNSAAMTQTPDNDPASQVADPIPDAFCATTYSDRKFCILKQALLELLDPAAESHWGNNVAVGLATYFGPQSNYVIDPEDSKPADFDTANGFVPTSRILTEVKPLDAIWGVVNGVEITQRQHLMGVISDLQPEFAAPLLGSYFDVLEYLSGGVALKDTSQHVESVLESANSTTYRQGLPDQDNQCSVNDHLIVLTGGQSQGEDLSLFANGGVTEFAAIRHFLALDSGTTTIGNGCSANTYSSLDSATFEQGITDCASALAAQAADVVDGKANGIVTHIVGISTPTILDAALEGWANAGAGTFDKADSKNELKQVINSAYVQAQDHSVVAVGPGVGINQAHQFSYLNDLYFSLFRPSNTGFWYGNLKKYKVKVKNNTPGIFDANDKNIDANGDGYFDAGVESYWFDDNDYKLPAAPAAYDDDGDMVYVGGAANRIRDLQHRRLYTTVNGQLTLLSGSDTATAAHNAVRAKMMPTGAYPAAAQSALNVRYSNVLRWLLGEDAATDNDNKNEWQQLTLDATDVPARTRRALYGSAIHSSPTVVNYTSTYQSGGQTLPLAAANQKNLVFMSTNDGKLYVVDGNDQRTDGANGALSGGAEKLAFMPETFITRPDNTTPSKVEALYSAARTPVGGQPLIYGLDGTWTAWRQDVNGDGNITAAAKDFVYLYGGMRRGGRHYFGLNMTDANNVNPAMSLLFELVGGSAGPLVNMGQTWSEPTLALIKLAQDRSMVVMIVGGGYDPAYDTGRPATTPLGAQIYIVAALDSGAIHAGDIMWWGSLGSSNGSHSMLAMTQSIPSKVKTLDRDGDGYTDHFYVGDLGGQLWRFDFDPDPVDDVSIIRGGEGSVIASVGVAALGGAASEGARNANDRRFFYPPSAAILKDVSGVKYVGLAIGSGLLTDPTNQLNTTVQERFYFIRDYQAFNASADAATVTAINLTLPSEKMLGSPLIVDGKVYYSTYYRGNAVATDACTVPQGKAALYSYTPGDAVSTTLLTQQPQSLASSLITLLITIPGTDANGNPDPSKDRTDLIGLGGGPAGAFDLPDVDMGKIRKTLWKQCGDETCN